MMKHRVNTDSRSLIRNHKHLSREIKNQRDARLWLTICKSLTHRRFFQRPHPSLLMGLLSSKASYGKTTLAFSHSTLRKTVVLTLNCSFLKTNALCSSSWLCTSLRDWAKNQMEYLVCLHIKIHQRQSYIIFGL